MNESLTQPDNLQLRNISQNLPAIAPHCTISIYHASMDLFTTLFSAVFDTPESEPATATPIDADGSGPHQGSGCTAA